MDVSSKKFDAIVIGSGFGGTMTALQLIEAGMRVLLIERGDWVSRGPHNWSSRASVDLTPHYDRSTPLYIRRGGDKPVMGLYACVGGPSVFYGAVSFRFREADFHPPHSIAGPAAAQWPISYADLEPWYCQAERLLDVAGDDSGDPTAPPRSCPWPQHPAPLAEVSQRIKDAALALGLHPFPLPLAINYRPSKGRQQPCVSCTTCDTYACAIQAKNDLATTIIPDLIARGLALVPNMVVVKIEERNGRVQHVSAVSKQTGEIHTWSAPRVILAAGALGSPHILLASGLPARNPAGHCVGRYLMRHVNAIVYGIHRGTADKEGRFHKQLAIMDAYFSDPQAPHLDGKIGSLQQMPTPPAALVENAVPGWLGRMLGSQVRRLTGLLAIAEDQPQYDNGIRLTSGPADTYGLPRIEISHTYSPRDRQAIRQLTRLAARIMRKAGALATYTHHIRTFSHAVGTVRMGPDPNQAPLDELCRFRGVEGLYVVDGSFMPTSAAVNPSLTIAANALRVGHHIAQLG